MLAKPEITSMASIGLSGPLRGYRPTRCDEGDLLRLGFGPLLPVTYQQPLGVPCLGEDQLH